MPYIGRELDSGNYLKLDDISSSFNGSTTTFNLTAAGKAFFPGSAFSILVNLAGVAQEPESAYQINNATITFATAPVAGDQFFCIVLGVAHGVNVPGNGTVNGAQLAKPFNYDGYFYLDDANNRVGVGTATPAKPLHVVGEGQFDSVRVLGDLTVDGTTTTLDTVVTEVDKLEVGANNNTVGVAITQSGSGDILNLYDGSSSVFRVLDGGNVKIGPAGNPGFGAGSGLEVERAGAATIRIEDTSSSSSFEIQNTGGIIKQRLYNNQPWTIEYGSGEKLRITSAGNIGIGENSPDVRLHVKETINTAYSLTNVADEANHILKLENASTTANAFSGMQFRVGSGADLFFGAIQQSVNHGDFFFANQNSPQKEMMRIKSTGLVGIGTNSPQSQFEVFGSSPIVRSKHSTSQKYTQINHNGTDGYVDWSSGNLILRGASDVERMRINSSGNVGIGTDNPFGKLQVHAGNDANFSFSTGGGEASLEILNDAGSANVPLNIRASEYKIKIQGNEKVRITSAGEALIGLITSRVVEWSPGNAGTPKFQVEGNSGGDSQILIIDTRLDGRNPSLAFAKTRNGAIVTDNDVLGSIGFFGDDGSDTRTWGGRITCEVDGTPGVNDMPGRLVFSTTADGAATPTERLRIDVNGRLTLSNSEGIQLSAKTSSVFALDGTLSYYATNNGVYLNGAGTNGWLRLNASGAENDQNTINIFGGSAGAYIQMRTGNAERLRIASDGQIGMGKAGTVTPNGNSPLTIQESDSNSETICLRATNSGGNGSQPGIVMKTAAGGHIGGIYCDVNSDYMRLSTSGTDRMIITNNGNIGINKTPYTKLDIHNGVDASVIVSIEGADSSSEYLGFGINGGQAVITAGGNGSTSNALVFRTAPSGTETERLRITSAGLVGINNTSPAVSLDLSNNTDAVSLPTGTTAQRPSGTDAYIRKNSTNNALEFYNGTNWVEIITDYFPTGSTTLG